MANLTLSRDATIEAACEVAEAECASRLPFVEIDPENPDCPLSVWTVTESGNHDADMATGVVYADVLARRCKQLGSLMGRVVLEGVLQEIVRKGKVGPIEQGFLGRVAMAAIVASQN
jgi:hypothetical protein